MAIAFRNAAYVDEADYSADCSKPTDTAENDILVGFCIGYTDAGASPTITQPAGWTEIATYKIETYRTWGLYWKRAGGSEGASYTFAIPNSGTCAIGAIIAAYSGFTVHTGTPYDQYSSTDYVTSDLIIRGGSIDPTASTSMAVWMGAGRASYLINASPTSGWTERVDARSTFQLYCQEKALASGDATGNIDVEFGAGSAEVRKHAFLLNLADPAAATTYLGFGSTSGGRQNPFGNDFTGGRA